VGIFAIIREALRIGRRHKSLWLFGFLVGLGGGGVNFGVLDAEQAPQPPVAATPPDVGTVLMVAGLVLVAIIAFVILKFLSTGALIEGVKRARQAGSMTVGEGFREGWAHWGVLFRLALIYAVVSFGSIVLLVGPCVLVFRAFGAPAVYFACAIAVIVGVPWLVTLYIWQAFAERIAVFENRKALDAIAKARLFLHGRLPLGLKLFVAGFVGVLFVALIGLVVVAPIAAIVVGSASVWGPLGAVALGALTLLPSVFVALAMVGIMTSSVWTIGYLSQVQQ